MLITELVDKIGKTVKKSKSIQLNKVKIDTVKKEHNRSFKKIDMLLSANRRYQVTSVKI